MAAVAAIKAKEPVGVQMGHHRKINPNRINPNDRVNTV